MNYAEQNFPEGSGCSSLECGFKSEHETKEPTNLKTRNTTATQVRYLCKVM